MPAFAYSCLRYSASAQKCGGVQAKMMRNSSSASEASSPGHRRPAQHRRHRARSPADHDVLRRERLQDHGVDDRVADERGQREPHRQRIHQRIQHARARCRRSTPAKISVCSEVSWPIGSGRARVRAMTASSFCSTRQLIAAAAPPPARCRACRTPAAASGGMPGRREEHADHRGEDDQRHDPRLGQPEQLLQARRRGLAGCAESD